LQLLSEVFAAADLPHRAPTAPLYSHASRRNEHYGRPLPTTLHKGTSALRSRERPQETTPTTQGTHGGRARGWGLQGGAEGSDIAGFEGTGEASSLGEKAALLFTFTVTEVA
jgi:hypothetical protein